MLKTFSAIAAAAIVAGLLTGFPGFGPEAAESSPAIPNVMPQAPAPTPACAHRGWPYQCGNEAKQVRVITVDRLR